MKTIILCGGMGMRLREETEFKPKPMINVGKMPILWHIMRYYSHFGHNQFILTLGYKGHMIKDHFSSNNNDCFEIIFAETGLKSLTGERILRASKYITEDEFMVTFGDGVTDLDLHELIRFHRNQKTLGTISGVRPYSKYGLPTINNKNLVIDFDEKPLMMDYVSGGFMIFKKEALKYFDKGPFEDSLVTLAAKRQLSMYKHNGFWKSMDTYREMEELNELWKKHKPWAIWEK